MYNFKTVDKVPIEILEHIAVQKAKHGKNLKVHIGTDAASKEGWLNYYLVVAFRYGSTGAHFVYHKEKIPIFRHGNGKPDVFNKLWKEAELTINFCEYVVENEILTREQIIIEMDYNGIRQTLSTKLIPATFWVGNWVGLQSYNEK